MVRTKTQPSSANKNSKPKAKKSTPKKPKRRQTTFRSPGNRLTVKQLFERRKFILDTVGQSNKTHDEEKDLYLRNTGSPKSNKKTIKFDTIIRYSTGEQLVIEFSDGDSAKKLMNIRARTPPTPDPVEKRVTRSKRKSKGPDEEEKPVLKKNKPEKSPSKSPSKKST